MPGSGLQNLPGFTAITVPGSNDVYFRQAASGTGSHFFVHSVTGSNSNSGLMPSQPVATIDYAVGHQKG